MASSKDNNFKDALKTAKVKQVRASQKAPEGWEEGATWDEAKGEGKLNKVVKKTLEHVARHRTLDLKQEMKGKTHTLGRIYRKVLEPICFIVGKIKKWQR